MNISRPWSREEDEFLLAHYEHLPVMEVSRALNRWHGSVSARARKFGLVSIKQKAHAAIRHDYFSAVSTPRQAYILGLLASDGWITGNEICIKLSEKDAELVELIRDELAPWHRIVPAQGRTLSFRVTSPLMKEDLFRYGVIPRKSLILKYPEILPSSLDNSFILGCFDGDGCLSRYGKDRRYWRWTLVSGSPAFLLAVKTRITTATGVNVSGPVPLSLSSKCQVISLTCSRITPVDAWLHADLPGLARKKLPVLGDVLFHLRAVHLALRDCLQIAFRADSPPGIPELVTALAPATLYL